MSSPTERRIRSYIPLIVAVSIVLGILIGTFYAQHFGGQRLNIVNSSSSKIGDLLQYVDDQYVDTVNIADLVEQCIPSLLSELDPHSSYINAKMAQSENEQLQGHFSGIGVRFGIVQDTIRVTKVIPDGPAQNAGLRAGDRIVTVDGKPLVGKELNEEEAIRNLKGEGGSKVKLGVKRYGSKKLISFTLTRADIPTPSVEASYMIDKTTGYIKLARFSENTYPEMLVALSSLNADGAKRLVFDLRGNLGGLLNAAIVTANEFLPAGRLIVYTEGRKSMRQNYQSDGRGSYQHLPLVVLVDEASASAAEIFAGAMQDNDRALIVGRRSFGKGLVQQPMEFRDGSQVRLTIARYYTPSGRCIQKPYEKGKQSEYEEDLTHRYERGEFFSSDSIHLAGPQYKTVAGRIVYGGGGIMPDIFVPQDTVSITTYYREALLGGYILSFVNHYVDTHNDIETRYESIEDYTADMKRQNLTEQFASYAASKGLKRRNLMLQRSASLFRRAILSNLAFVAFDESQYNRYLNMDDPVIKKALQQFDRPVVEETK